MTLRFKGSDKPTLGVEIELQVLHPTTFDLLAESEKLLKTCETQGLLRVKAEIHQSMIEVDTEISSNVKECKEFLKQRLTKLDEITESLGLKFSVTGTHPFQRWKDRIISNSDRYQNLHEKFQWLVRRMNVYGMHVHVGVPTGEKALKVSTALIRYLPHLLALSANSPFWQGVDTGMHSSRLNILESFPYAGIPPLFKNWTEFEHYYETLKNAGVISSLKDLYWYIRPNLEYGTIELRICDAPSTLQETLALVALIQCLVVSSLEKIDNGQEEVWTQEQHWISVDNLWNAAKDGLDAVIVTGLKEKRYNISEEILNLIEKLLPTARVLDCEEELLYLHHILQDYNGATRQRLIYNETQSLRDVVAVTMHEFKTSFLEPAFNL